MSIASFNVRGIPMRGDELVRRLAYTGDSFDSSDIDVVCLQEVWTYAHLRLLKRHMPSYPHVVYRRGLRGPSGDVVIFSRPAPAGTGFRRLSGTGSSGLPLRTRLTARMKGLLAIDLSLPRLRIHVTHPSANSDGDWSATSRYARLHQAQLASIGDAVNAADGPTIVCGDFNVARDSPLFASFMAATDLRDAFEGRCPPTFRKEYLSPDASLHCIDFILAAGAVRVERTETLFADDEPPPSLGVHVSDHLGLRADLRV